MQNRYYHFLILFVINVKSGGVCAHGHWVKKMSTGYEWDSLNDLWRANNT